MKNYKKILGIDSTKSAIAEVEGKKIIIEDLDLCERLMFDEPVSFYGATFSNEDILSSYVSAFVPVINDNDEIERMDLGIAQYEVYTKPNGHKSILIHTMDKNQDLIITQELVKFVETQFASDSVDKVELFVAGKQNDHSKFANLGYNHNLEKSTADAYSFSQDYEGLFMDLIENFIGIDEDFPIVNEVIAFRNGYPELAPHLIIEEIDDADENC
ncbi:MAG: hypothetical protein IJW24_01720 [Clostridia bacterium]|nr:hypothetical protein [Clostridia bacterium]